MSDALELEFHGESRRPVALRLLADGRLARRAAAGDRAAFAVIFERHHQALHRYCRALLRHEEDARDALQNTFTRALQALEGEERDIAVRPWLFRIAHNEAISLARRRRPHRELVPELAGTTPGADAQAIATERLRDLLADLDELPERQRSALVLRELNDLGYDDIGAALETSEQAARQSVYEARVMLAQLQAGRAMPCEEIRVRISAQDGRLLRPRRIRAHLRACEGCRAFHEAIGARRADLGALAPPLAPAAAAALLHGVLGSGGGGATGGGGGLLAALGIGQGTTVAATGAKTVALVAVAATVGGGSLVVQQRVLPAPHRTPAEVRPAAADGIRPAPAGTGGSAVAPAGTRAGTGRRPAAPRRAPGASGQDLARSPASTAAPVPATTTPPGHGQPSGRDAPAESAAPAPEAAATHPTPPQAQDAPRGSGSAGNSAGGNPTPGTPPAHSNAGGNGKGKAKGLANAPSTTPAATGLSDTAASGTAAAPDTSPNSANANANGQANGNGNGKAKGQAGGKAASAP